MPQLEQSQPSPGVVRPSTEPEPVVADPAVCDHPRSPVYVRGRDYGPGFGRRGHHVGERVSVAAGITAEVYALILSK